MEKGNNTIKVNLETEEYIVTLPKNYINVDNVKINRKKISKDNEGNIKEEIVEFSPIIVVPIQVINNIDNYQEKVNIAIKKYNKWKVIPIPKKMLSSYSDILQLATFGIPVNSLNSKEWLNYFQEFEQECFLTGKTPVITAVNKLGWRDKSFIPFSKEYIVDVDTNLQRVLEAYHRKGTLEEWVQNIEKLELRKNILFRFILASSFGGPLLKIIGHRIFGVYNYGASRAGKTSMLLTALSVWGEPVELCATFNHTAVGIERMANLRNDLILGIDERQIQKSQTELEKLMFMLCSGKGKVRGNKTGGIQVVDSFNLIILMTGESTLATGNSTTGISTRIMELEGSPYDYNEELSSKMYEVSSNYYGTAGPEFIKIINEKYSGNNFEELKNKYDEIKEKIKTNTKNDISSYISSVSLVTLADLIISKELFKVDNEEESINMGLEILKKLPSSEDTDIIEKSYKSICSWILANNNSFDKPKQINVEDCTDDVEHMGYGKSYGLQDGDIFYIHTSIFKEWCDSNNLSENRILSGWAEKGYILTKTNSKNKVEYSIQKKFKGRNGRMVAVIYKISEETETARNLILIKTEEKKRKEKELKEQEENEKREKRKKAKEAREKLSEKEKIKGIY